MENILINSFILVELENAVAFRDAREKGDTSTQEEAKVLKALKKAHPVNHTQMTVDFNSFFDEQAPQKDYDSILKDAFCLVNDTDLNSISEGISQELREVSIHF